SGLWPYLRMCSMVAGLRTHQPTCSCVVVSSFTKAVPQLPAPITAMLCAVVIGANIGYAVHIGALPDPRPRRVRWLAALAIALATAPLPRETNPLPRPRPDRLRRRMDPPDQALPSHDRPEDRQPEPAGR